MDHSNSPSAERELGWLQLELGALQAGQVAEVARLGQALEQAQAERGAAAAEVAQLQDEVARLNREVVQLRGRCANYQMEAKLLRATDQQQREATAAATRLRGELGRLRAQQEALGQEHQELRHQHHQLCRQLRGCRRHRDAEGPLPVLPPPKDPQDSQFEIPEETQSQETTGSLKPIVFFILASSILFLYSRLGNGWHPPGAP